MGCWCLVLWEIDGRSLRDERILCWAWGNTLLFLEHNALGQTLLSTPRGRPCAAVREDVVNTGDPTLWCLESSPGAPVEAPVYPFHPGLWENSEYRRQTGGLSLEMFSSSVCFPRCQDYLSKRTIGLHFIKVLLKHKDQMFSQSIAVGGQTWALSCAGEERKVKFRVSFPALPLISRNLEASVPFAPKPFIFILYKMKMQIIWKVLNDRNRLCSDCR